MINALKTAIIKATVQELNANCTHYRDAVREHREHYTPTWAAEQC